MTDFTSKKYIIIGGGIVGMSTAYQLMRRDPHCQITVLEKEDGLCRHQTGRNSGVIHSGIYYKPGSLKATNCVQGRKQLVEFCESYGVAYEMCGKVIVALDEDEEVRLKGLLKRGLENGVRCEWLEREALLEREPHVQGRSAVLVHDTGIVDYVGMTHTLQELMEESGRVEFQFNCEIQNLQIKESSAQVMTHYGNLEAETVINCSGLQSDRVARKSGLDTSLKIMPFRGEYYVLKQSTEHLCKHLIYPVPDPRFPFLGVHFTRMIHGGVDCGPNAVLAFGREAYKKTDFNLRDMMEVVGFSGFWKMGARHWKMGLEEMWRSASKTAFVKSLQRLIPEIKAEDLEVAPSGIRAQAILPNGNLVDDFYIEKKGVFIHVGNAPSPAATASLQIGKTIIEAVFKEEVLEV